MRVSKDVKINTQKPKKEKKSSYPLVLLKDGAIPNIVSGVTGIEDLVGNPAGKMSLILFAGTFLLEVWFLSLF